MNTKITKYYMACETDYEIEDSIPLVNSHDALIGYVPALFFADMALEGTGKLHDGRVVNVNGGYTEADARITQVLTNIANTRFRGHLGYAGLSQDGQHYMTFDYIPNCEWGKGTHATDLYPFAHVAADPAVYSFGTALSIPALKDMPLPNGEVHQGLVKVVDVGSAIKGQHLDLFCGTRSWARQLNIPDYLEVEVWSV